MPILDKKEVEKIVEKKEIGKPVFKKKESKAETPCIKCRYKFGHTACLSCVDRPKEV